MTLDQFNFEMQASRAAEFISLFFNTDVETFVIAGTGLSNLGQRVAEQQGVKILSFQDIANEVEDFPVPSVGGHPGYLALSPDGKTLISAGIIHNNETVGKNNNGKRYTLSDEERQLRTIMMPYVVSEMGVDHAIVTDACGLLWDVARPGDAVFVDDYLRSGNFPDFTEYMHPDEIFFDPKAVCSPEIRELGITVAKMMGLNERAERNSNIKVYNKGTFALVRGPSFEFRREGDALRALLSKTFEDQEYYKHPNPDVVGMAGMPEMLHFAMLKIPALHIGLSTDYVIGPLQKSVSHEENQEIGKKSEPIITRLVHNIVGNLRENGLKTDNVGLYNDEKLFSYDFK